MKADDVTATLELALDASGLDKARIVHRPRLLSDNGSSYISDDLAKWMKRHEMAHVRQPGNRSTLEDGRACAGLDRGVPGRRAGASWVFLHCPRYQRARPESGAMQVVMHELSHRAKNLLAIVMSVAYQMGPAEREF
jgi:two-component sensor histidine kinase